MTFDPREVNRAGRHSAPYPTPHNFKLDTPGKRHNWTLAHLCASNPRRNALRKGYRAARTAGVRVRKAGVFLRLAGAS